MASDKQIILVTGANNGIGYDTSSLLARASPNHHVIVSARSAAKGDKAVQQIQALKPQGSVSFLQLDVADDDSIAAAAKKVESEFGRLDVLVNNAGICPLDEPSRQVLRSVFDTNVFGPFLLTRALQPLLLKSKTPVVVNVSSELGSITKRSDPNDPWYAIKGPVYRMSKSALDMMAADFHAELRDAGGRVFAFCPGYVVTDLTGAEQRDMRKQSGAESSETSAQGILEIVLGNRDAHAGFFVRRDGTRIPW